jgi:hypothetical protein
MRAEHANSSIASYQYFPYHILVIKLQLVQHSKKLATSLLNLGFHLIVALKEDDIYIPTQHHGL